MIVFRPVDQRQLVRLSFLIIASFLSLAATQSHAEPPLASGMVATDYEVLALAWQKDRSNKWRKPEKPAESIADVLVSKRSNHPRISSGIPVRRLIVSSQSPCTAAASMPAIRISTSSAAPNRRWSKVSLTLRPLPSLASSPPGGTVAAFAASPKRPKSSRSRPSAKGQAETPRSAPSNSLFSAARSWWSVRAVPTSPTSTLPPSP